MRAVKIHLVVGKTGFFIFIFAENLNFYVDHLISKKKKPKKSQKILN